MRTWADLDGDLDLEWAGAIYNDELRQSEAGYQADRGVFVYENTGRALLPLRLTNPQLASARRKPEKSLCMVSLFSRYPDSPCATPGK